MKMKKFIRWIRPTVGIANESTRECWLEKALRSIPKGSRILDAGAGTQRYRKFCTHLNYVSQDFAEYDGKGDSAGLQTETFDYGKLDIVSDIISIPESDSSFDAILCVEVLEHVPDPILAIKEFARLLQPEGVLILTAPFCSLTHLAPYHFCTGFNKYWYEKHLNDNSFSIVEIVPNGNYFEYLAQEVYRVPFVSDRYSKHKPHWFEYFGMYLVQRMLRRFSRRESNSSEFLCYGYHILARKVK
ncbi:MAG: class I SAM-dependent methyltransferase [Sedimentisphaerales bacterium]|nr:class I SAM-dependent methyltransferase [Sedimentisphaerales bacterium]